MAANNVDISRFQGDGLNFRAKLIGIEDVAEARGDQICQDSLVKLKNAVRASGQHKQKVFVNVTMDGIKIIDAVTLEANKNKKKNELKGSKTPSESEEKDKDTDGAVLHSHAVHRISFIARDVTDNRAFGYIYGETEEQHKFYAIKTAAAAEQLVYTIRDLFQAVYEAKKKEMEEAKKKMEKGEVETPAQNGEGNSQTPGNGSTSGSGQTPLSNQNADGDNIYSVPPNNAPVKPEPEQNLFDLEDQTEHILKGIEQIKNLDFDSIAEATSPTPSSPATAPVTPASGNDDLWGLSSVSSPAAPAPSGPTSALGDLSGLQTSTLPTIPGAGFPGSSPFQMQPGFGAAPSMVPRAGLPVIRDPFANDPFAQQHPPAPAGAFPASNPFGGPAGGFAPPPRPMAPGMPGAGGFMAAPQPFPGQMAPAPAANPFGMGFPASGMPAAQQPNLFGQPAESASLLQPLKSGGGQEEVADSAAPPKKSADDLFGDLLNIKKSTGATSGATSPKELFTKSPVEKKSMNAMMAEQKAPPQAAQASNLDLFESEPFGSSGSLERDKTRGLLASGSEDPFDTSHVPQSFSEPPPIACPTPPSSSISVDTPPPVPRRPETATKPLNSSVPILPSPSTYHASPKPLRSSLSSSSSSSAPSPSSSPSPLPKHKVDYMPPPGKPPPLPKRAVGDTVALPKPCDIQTPPTELSVRQNRVDSPFTLPSPDEPPPPPPRHQTGVQLPPPPPPPRPDSKLSSQTSSVSNSPAKKTTASGVNGPSHGVDQTRDDFDSIFLDESDLKEKSDISRSGNESSSADDVFLTADKDTKSVNSTESQARVNNFDPFSPPLSKNLTHKSREASKGEKVVFTDPFSLPLSGKAKPSLKMKDPFSELRSESTADFPTTDSEDPFKMPLHLTPGFKAEAKFGNDPFEDSFSAALHDGSSDNKWNPFSENSDTTVDENSNKDFSVLSSPFGDAFAPPQQNGNSEQSLFD